jgi:hypothetical protein
MDICRTSLTHLSLIIYLILAELEAATSTTHSEAPPKTPADPSEWSIEDVIQHIAFIDPALGVHADLFRKHVSSTDNNEIYFETFLNSVCLIR